MHRTDRLFAITRVLRDGALHRAEDIAAALDVSVRTIYRDMDRLCAIGVPVEGERGGGYRMADRVPLPPLTLSPAEMAALDLGIAIVAEASDPDLSAAARSLADKIDAALPVQGVPPQAAWKHAAHPSADAARGLSHMATLRSAVSGRQKLELDYPDAAGAIRRHAVRPLALDNFGRVWTLVAWSETAGGFREFRLDLIESARPLPELFVDAPGRRLEDFRAATSR